LRNAALSDTRIGRKPEQLSLALAPSTAVASCPSAEADSPLVGLTIQLARSIDRPCRCGDSSVTIGSSTKVHAGSLHCAQCGVHRGWLPKNIEGPDAVIIEGVEAFPNHQSAYSHVVAADEHLVWTRPNWTAVSETKMWVISKILSASRKVIGLGEAMGPTSYHKTN